eukprot:COSAG02_NODE_1815_length_10777_cov_7.005712_2_plen_100_part_00
MPKQPARRRAGRIDTVAGTRRKGQCSDWCVGFATCSAATKNDPDSRITTSQFARFLSLVVSVELVVVVTLLISLLHWIHSMYVAVSHCKKRIMDHALNI